HRRFQSLGEAHAVEPLDDAFAVGLGVFPARFSGGCRVDERIVHDNRRRFRREHAAVGEELAQPDRHVGACEERAQRLLRNVRQRAVGNGADLGVWIVEQQDQDPELLVGARREGALGRQQSDVARHLAAFEEVEEWRRRAHRAATKLPAFAGVTRVVTTSPVRPIGRASAPFTVSTTADPSPAVSTSSRWISSVRASPGCSSPSIAFCPSTVAEIQHARFTLRPTTTRSAGADATSVTLGSAAAGCVVGVDSGAGVADVGAGGTRAGGGATGNAAGCCSRAAGARGDGSTTAGCLTGAVETRRPTVLKYRTTPASGTLSRIKRRN